MTSLEKMLIKQEALRLRTYRCTAGKLTIGIGHNLDANPLPGFYEDMPPITNEVAMKILADDIDACRQECVKTFLFFNSLDSVRQDALINLCFNMGMHVLLQFKNTLKAIADHRWEDADKGLESSLWAKQVGKTRSGEIRHMILTGTYP